MSSLLLGIGNVVDMLWARVGLWCWLGNVEGRLALDKVPAKHEGWMGWMLEVWEEHREWCSGSQAAELSSVAHNRLVTVALVADGMVEVGTEWRQWRVFGTGGCQHVWKSGPG